ncbi:epoxyqueuosine reductase [Aminipila butyrica]|uniref:Epoxyqueuosine reductase n=1 Tax=Aminipila butyrica TaxID=433296 RepID=A0A858BSD9_9FIRM|nr:epoxyqueuosine reductase [Aminipila butyrica]QIB68823.1 epoxyqueuosine reductase [Aminipila butyrica]
MKEKITHMIQDFVQSHGERDEIRTKWGEPLVGFAAADHAYVLRLKEVVAEHHRMPKDVLPDASIVVSYFVPFTRELAKTNQTLGALASQEWALAYEETNAMFIQLNRYLIEEMEKIGYKAGTSPEALTFDQEQLKSNWSQRHFARAAGLGTFGINNMLITKKGCCGRYNSVVTNLDVAPDQPLEEDYCLYKKNGGCKVCLTHCPTQALTVESFNRYKCHEVLKENARKYNQFGSSYTDETGTLSNSLGSEVCGKCVVGLPCSFFKLI